MHGSLNSKGIISSKHDYSGVWNHRGMPSLRSDMGEMLFHKRANGKDKWGGVAAVKIIHFSWWLMRACLLEIERALKLCWNVLHVSSAVHTDRSIKYTDLFFFFFYLAPFFLLFGYYFLSHPQINILTKYIYSKLLQAAQVYRNNESLYPNFKPQI